VRQAHAVTITEEGLVSRELATRRLVADALAGRLDRRTVLTRAAALGVSVPVMGLLARATSMPALAGDPETLEITSYDWQAALHPGLTTYNEEFSATIPTRAEIAPSANFSADIFLSEAADKKSTWDVYTGVTPFLEMVQLISADVIEPWDPYVPEGVLDDLFPPVRDEGSYDGKFYVWPWLLDIIVDGWNADIVSRAGLDPDAAPVTWDELIANAKKVMESGAAPFGVTFDYHAWRSLIPISHSISLDVYEPETGLFMWNGDVAVQALEIMKELMPLANPDVLNPGATDGGVNQTPDEQAFASQQVAYYIKYQNAHLRFASTWPDPSQIRFGALPKTEDGAGGTVFWTTGSVLLKYGENKEEAGQYLNGLIRDQRIWENSVKGNLPENPAVGQLPVLQSLWAEYEEQKPDWLADWAFAIKNSLPSAQAIKPTILSIQQFDLAAPFYLAYLRGEESDAKTALDKAMDAVRTAYDDATA
jgi:multiple sugar transport system substrate-binding protein